MGSLPSKTGEQGKFDLLCTTRINKLLGEFCARKRGLVWTMWTFSSLLVLPHYDIELSSYGVESINFGFKSGSMHSLFRRSIRMNKISTVAKTYVESNVESWVQILCKRRFEYVQVDPLSRYMPDHGFVFFVFKWPCSPS